MGGARKRLWKLMNTVFVQQNNTRRMIMPKGKRVFVTCKRNGTSDVNYDVQIQGWVCRWILFVQICLKQR
jgi:hypothetical protein